MKLRTPFFILLCLPVLLAACSGKSTAAVTPQPPVFTPTPDLCSDENLPAEAAKVNKLMREFDDYSTLASNTPQAQLVTVIPELQRVLREAQDQSVPLCLDGLKKLQISHMTVVVQTLIAFMGSSDVNLINAGISQARDLHLQYDVELARLLGVTLTVPPAPTSAPPTPGSNLPPEMPAGPPVHTVINPGPNVVNLRSAPDFNAPQVGVLAVQGSVLALGKTQDDQWLLVEMPEQPAQTAWIYAGLLQLSAPIEELAVVTP
ncbi:MAG: SH3 domain-containing protein [Anaerolineales bacterium]|nr:MAG: SH3 domain-containing protein [Anaerolineales bacterium]